MGTHRRKDDRLPLWRKMVALCAIVLAAGLLAVWSLSATVVTAAAPATPTEMATSTPSATPSFATEAPSVEPTVDYEPDPKISLPVNDATSRPLTITSAELGFEGTPLATMQAGAPGADIVPPVSETDPIESFKPYWISDLGLVGPTSQDTGYIIGHACTAYCAPDMLRFNRLGDLKPGNVISFTTEKGKVVCKVTHSVTYDQEAPATEKGDTWGHYPGYVVIISCSPKDFHGKSTSVFAKCESA